MPSGGSSPKQCRCSACTPSMPPCAATRGGWFAIRAWRSGPHEDERHAHPAPARVPQHPRCERPEPAAPQHPSPPHPTARLQRLEHALQVERLLPRADVEAGLKLLLDGALAKRQHRAAEGAQRIEVGCADALARGAHAAAAAAARVWPQALEPAARRGPSLPTDCHQRLVQRRNELTRRRTDCALEDVRKVVDGLQRARPRRERLVEGVHLDQRQRGRVRAPVAGHFSSRADLGESESPPPTNPHTPSPHRCVHTDLREAQEEVVA
eukprot:6694302-Prymnesium_polylepis.1